MHWVVAWETRVHVGGDDVAEFAKIMLPRGKDTCMGTRLICRFGLDLFVSTSFT